MDGVLCVNKPEGFTSFDVIAKLRGILRMKKLGHSGTLDPMATGVLPVFLGRATKAISLIPNHDKEYFASFSLGYTTDTLDRTGETIERFSKRVTALEVKRVLDEFIGEIWQTPPMYSAVKKNGVPLYKLARKGESIEREKRKAVVYNISQFSFNEETQSGSFSISCSAGTYIRTICDDIGKVLGTGGVLTDLCRTKACGFSIKNCLTFDEIEKLNSSGEISSCILPISALFSQFPSIRLSGADEKKFSNGVPLNLSTLPNIAGQVAVYGKNSFLGIASPVDRKLKIDKLFI